MSTHVRIRPRWGRPFTVDPAVLELSVLKPSQFVQLGKCPVGVGDDGVLGSRLVSIADRADVISLVVVTENMKFRIQIDSDENSHNKHQISILDGASFGSELNHPLWKPMEHKTEDATSAEREGVEEELKRGFSGMLSDVTDRPPERGLVGDDVELVLRFLGA